MTEKALKPIKPFLNYEEQIKNLIERKGMVITDRKFAASKLEDISYFALIDGYKNLFYNPMTRKYREGTTFEDIVALYEFDEKTLIKEAENKAEECFEFLTENNADIIGVSKSLKKQNSELYEKYGKENAFKNIKADIKCRIL